MKGAGWGRHKHAVSAEDQAVLHMPWCTTCDPDGVADMAQLVVDLELGAEVVVEGECRAGEHHHRQGRFIMFAV